MSDLWRRAGVSELKTIKYRFLLSFLSQVGSITNRVYRGEVRRPYDESRICSHKLYHFQRAKPNQASIL